jgi:glycosyltransferase involved in cell wall biosynthesis
MKTTQVSRPQRIAQIANTLVDTRKLPFEPETMWACPDCNLYYSAKVYCPDCQEVTEETPVPTMIELYEYAHAFMLPSMGEGFGLTLAEAMSTGLPCIYTPWSGPADFCSSKEGFPVKFKMHDIKTQKILPNGERRHAHTSRAASADIDSIVRKMEQIYYYYDDALRKGKLAAERIRRDITWDKSAASFIEIIKTIGGEK